MDDAREFCLVINRSDNGKHKKAPTAAQVFVGTNHCELDAWLRISDELVAQQGWNQGGNVTLSGRSWIAFEPCGDWTVRFSAVLQKWK